MLAETDYGILKRIEAERSGGKGPARDLMNATMCRKIRQLAHYSRLCFSGFAGRRNRKRAPLFVPARLVQLNIILNAVIHS